MSLPIRLLIVALDDLRLGIPLEVVERVVRAAEVTPLANAPLAVLGVINLHGEVVPVLDLRDRFRLPARSVHVDDQFVIARLPRRAIAIVVDDTQEIAEFAPDAMVPATEVLPWLERIQGVIRLEDGLLLVNDPERFLDADDWNALTELEESAS